VDNKRIAVRTRKWVVEWLTQLTSLNKRIELALNRSQYVVYTLICHTKLSIKNTRKTFKLQE